MFGLAAALRRAGHRTRFFAYSPTLEPLPRIVRRLTTHLHKLRGPVGLVGHSLGGLLLRQAVAERPDLPVRHLVMLGSPNRPPRLARSAWDWWLFRRLAGECGAFLADPHAVARLPVPPVPYTLIAGTAGPVGRWSPFGDLTNDGVVAVDEVPIQDSDTPLLIPTWHTLMMDHPQVRQAVLERLGSA